MKQSSFFVSINLQRDSSSLLELLVLCSDADCCGLSAKHQNDPKIKIQELGQGVESLSLSLVKTHKQRVKIVKRDKGKRNKRLWHSSLWQTFESRLYCQIATIFSFYTNLSLIFNCKKKKKKTLHFTLIII